MFGSGGIPRERTVKIRKESVRFKNVADVWTEMFAGRAHYVVFVHILLAEQIERRLIEDPGVMRRILEHLGLWTPLPTERSPPVDPASYRHFLTP